MRMASQSSFNGFCSKIKESNGYVFDMRPHKSNNSRNESIEKLQAMKIKLLRELNEIN